MIRILAIDQGTTNTKALLVGAGGQVIARASRPIPIEFPAPGWVQQDAEAIWRSVLGAVEECLNQAPGARPAALGLSNQRETLVVWDRDTQRALAPCISWQCRRSAPICDALKASGAATMIRGKTGLPVDPMFSASKASWLLRDAPDLASRAKRGEICIGTIDSWLLYRLTGGAVHATDTSNASRTLLMDIETGAWSTELAAAFAIPEAALPLIRPSSGFFGETADLARIPAGIPITGVAGDSHAAMFGHGAFDEGSVKATYGTGASLMMLSNAPSPAALSRTVAWNLGGVVRHALEGNITSAGATVDWFARFMAGAGAAEALRGAPSAEGVFLVPAFAGLGAPHWDDRARALLCGISFGTSAAHVARAAMESIAYQVSDVLGAMMSAAGGEIAELMADGGASRSDGLMQFQADIIGRPVVRNRCADLSAFGAALLAGLGAGTWRDEDEVKALQRQTDRFAPAITGADRARLLEGWRDAVRRATMAPPTNAEGRASCAGTNSE